MTIVVMQISGLSEKTFQELNTLTGQRILVRREGAPKRHGFRNFFYFRGEGLDDYRSRIIDFVKGGLHRGPFNVPASGNATVIFACMEVKQMRARLTNRGPKMLFLNKIGRAHV